LTGYPGMKSKLAIFVCEHYHLETAAVIDREDFDDILVKTYPAHCGRPSMEWDFFQEQVTDLDQTGRIEIYGSSCLKGLDKAPSGMPETVLHRLDQCFHLIAPPAIVDSHIRDGSYVTTPGWLVRWQEWIKTWGFDRKTAREYFAESTSNVVLFDTGVDENSTRLLEDFATFIDRPSLVIPVGLEYFHLVIQKTVMAWKYLVYETMYKEEIKLQKKEKSDYAMIMDLLKAMVMTQDIDRAIQTVLDLFTMLYSPGTLFFVQFGDSDPVIHGDATADEVETAINLSERNVKAEYEWLESAEGFLLKMNRNKERLGLLVADRFQFSQYKNHYLNLSLSIMSVCGLAIDNASSYQKIVAAEKDARESRELLTGKNRELEKTNRELSKALEDIKQLKGILPICASCKQIRTDDGYWMNVEKYFATHSDLEFSHGICPECMTKLYPDYSDDSKDH
jgi:hypothetical protein